MTLHEGIKRVGSAPEPGSLDQSLLQRCYNELGLRHVVCNMADKPAALRDEAYFDTEK